ncbi:HalOD1 output domain-containing protein [Haloprofundus salilacus]|uniref:HalOD1 output domain-containing protein n=1 Tax=Haloprofundus salilacus TaxID=2876190 RepID=UPI001CD00882|nr:HalOD1 output domain-containing protein [Haloprofundus salilacus]
MAPTDDDPSITHPTGGHGESDRPLDGSDHRTAANDVEPPTIAVEYSVDDDQSLSEAVVFAVAEAEGCTALELDEPLYNWIDPDALDAVFRLSREEVTADRLFSFRAYGREVLVVDRRAVHVSHPVDT